MSDGLYHVTAIRTVEELVTLEVEADSAEEACELVRETDDDWPVLDVSSTGTPTRYRNIKAKPSDETSTKD